MTRDQKTRCHSDSGAYDQDHTRDAAFGESDPKMHRESQDNQNEVDSGKPRSSVGFLFRQDSTSDTVPAAPSNLQEISTSDDSIACTPLKPQVTSLDGQSNQPDSNEKDARFQDDAHLESRGLSTNKNFWGLVKKSLPPAPEYDSAITLPECELPEAGSSRVSRAPILKRTGSGRKIVYKPHRRVSEYFSLTGGQPKLYGTEIYNKYICLRHGLDLSVAREVHNFL